MSPVSKSQDLLRRIPAIHRLLEASDFKALLAVHSRARVVEGLRQDLEALRQQAFEGTLAEDDLRPESIHRRVTRHLEERERRYYRRVVNATGVILHTGLGRAPLATPVVESLAEVSSFPQRVEIDLESGERGGRDRGCDLLLRELVGCEEATVVNNNAAATVLILGALARGKKVLLSRGELVEIGGSFRIPDIMEESGAILAEVGTTNRTHEKDYVNAIDEETALILKVHTSNYRVVGFTKEVALERLVAIGREHGIPVVHDLGSGCLVDLAARGRRGEHLVSESIAAGADLVCFSGDKLLGGPQAGLIAGREEAVMRCRRHPLFRAMRPGRLVYTALEETLRLYVRGEDQALEAIPALRRLLTPPEELEPRATDLAGRLGGLPGCAVEVVECNSQTGSGSLPARDIPSFGVRVSPSKIRTSQLAALLRRGEPSILARVQDEALIFDLRTLDDDELPWIVERLGEALAESSP